MKFGKIKIKRCKGCKYLDLTKCKGWSIAYCKYYLDKKYYIKALPIICFKKKKINKE